MEPKTPITEAHSFCERKPSIGKAFLVELSDEEDSDLERSSSETLLRSRNERDVMERCDEPIRLPVVIDLKQAADKSGDKKAGHADGGRPKFKGEQEPQIACFTCFIGPCPEVVNANFKHSEFMICYRDGNSRCENGMMRYYCCPLYLVTIKKDGEETFELRAVQTESSFQSADFNGGAGAGASAGHQDWHKYYGAQPPHQQPQANLGGMGSHHSFSNHHFNCRQVPPQFNFLHHCSCTCPPQMMAYYLNYRFQSGAPPAAQQQPHPTASGQQQAFRQFAYQPTTYMFPAPGSAMG